MQGQVPALSMFFMVVSLAISVALPVGLLVYFRKKKKADILPFFIGCAVMILFAFVLERILSFFIMRSPAGATIRNNLWLYAVVGGLLAAVFEETGRFLAFKTVLKKYQAKDANALMYGAGHGGVEALAILGLASLNNLIISAMINSGSTAILTAPLSGDILKQVEDAIQTLIRTPSGLFLLGGVERIFAVILQISLSVLVWFAVKKKNRRFLFPVALLIHFSVDAATVIASGSGASVVLVELMIAAAAAATAFFARKVYRAETESPDQCLPPLR